MDEHISRFVAVSQVARRQLELGEITDEQARDVCVAAIEEDKREMLSLRIENLEPGESINVRSGTY